LIIILVNISKLEPTSSDTRTPNMDEAFPVGIEMSKSKKCVEFSAVGNSNGYVKVKTVFDYESEISGKKWNTFNSLFLLVSILCILMLFVCIGSCATLCDLSDDDD